MQQKKKKPKHKPKQKSKGQGIMDRSDIPYAQRMAMQHKNDIVAHRVHISKILMFCNSLAMHEVKRVGYKRQIRFANHLMNVRNEFYEDPEMGMAHAVRRMEQMRMPISGDYYSDLIEGLSQKEQEIQDHRLHEAQITMICIAISMNDVFGYGRDVQFQITRKANEFMDKYKKKGMKFLLDEMEKIGFEIIDGEVVGYEDDDGNGITPKKWREQRNGL